jgi:hypothetical protein
LTLFWPIFERTDDLKVIVLVTKILTRCEITYIWITAAIERIDHHCNSLPHFMLTPHNPFHSQRKPKQPWYYLTISRTKIIISLAVLVCWTVIFSDANNSNNSNSSNMAVSAAHSEATLALAEKESAEHMHGMAELYEEMRKRPLIVKAYAMDDANAPADAMTVHFVRHGQGFHNLMADIASAAGTKWTQVRLNNPFRFQCYKCPLCF